MCTAKLRRWLIACCMRQENKALETSGSFDGCDGGRVLALYLEQVRHKSSQVCISNGHVKLLICCFLMVKWYAAVSEWNYRWSCFWSKEEISQSGEKEWTYFDIYISSYTLTVFLQGSKANDKTRRCSDRSWHLPWFHSSWAEEAETASVLRHIDHWKTKNYKP